MDNRKELVADLEKKGLDHESAQICAVQSGDNWDEAIRIARTRGFIIDEL